MGLFNAFDTKKEHVENTQGSGGGGETPDSIARMKAAFDNAIDKSATVTEVTTEKKADLDAAKQRPQN